MPDLVFACGPSDNYFVQTPTQWAIKELPPHLQKRFSAPAEIGHVHQMVLGANESYYCSYRKRGGDTRNYQVHQGLPANLAAWLEVKDKKGFVSRDIVNMRLTLGPNNESFFVTDGKDYLWCNLPTELDAAINKLRKPRGGFTHAPKIVSLGANKTYVMGNAGGGGSWNLGSSYPDLETELALLLKRNLSGGMFNQINYVSLDPHSGGNFALTTPGGIASYRFPDPWDDAVVPVFDSLPKPTATSQVQRGSAAPARSTGASLLGAVIGGVVKGSIAGLVGANSNLGGGGGGGGGSGGGAANIDFSGANAAFQQSLQNNMWSSVQGAANW